MILKQLEGVQLFKMEMCQTTWWELFSIFGGGVIAAGERMERRPCRAAQTLSPK
jgi:hypothetical protein